MRVSQLLQFIFIGLLLIGIFASMAQNDYGIELMGAGCFGLAALYFLQMIWELININFSIDRNNFLLLSELFLFSILSALFGFRSLYIVLPAGETVFIVVGILLLIVHIVIALDWNKKVAMENLLLARHIFFFNGAVALLLSVMIIRIFNPYLSFALGFVGIILIAPITISIIKSTRYDYAGKTWSLIQVILKSKHKTGLLFVFFIASGVYLALSGASIVPSIENAQMPRTYIELVNRAEAGDEKPIEGKYQHEKYREALSNFLDRHGKK
jgi:hypothetical protein